MYIGGVARKLRAVTYQRNGARSAAASNATPGIITPTTWPSGLIAPNAATEIPRAR